ncbi:hypothetical protein J1N35_041661 [Gossypium stocksii]|uniref:Aminotransferase-like plant mobile domain-containing protein n=1 Tax=Gossypium stocksii TaxID=47602 RepID=A0A9D3UGD4_9ROSI|nr:hypothetical protein J1N35_041661 [Gossypium stocksii]
MTGELIHLNYKHISFKQMKMSVDRVLQCYIRNMSNPPSLFIENYLREVGFWHVATIRQGCNLDSKLIISMNTIRGFDNLGSNSDEFFQNSNIWHAKVPFVTYATVEMHQMDRVLRQFGFRQPIPVAPEVLDNEHKIDLQ